MTYWLYGKVLEKNLMEGQFLDVGDNPWTHPATLKLNGFALGLALGATVGMALFLSTCWLVLRGTANESVHAMLLGNYLPHYSVTVVGGFIGALELFFIVFTGNVILSAVYNKVADVRIKGRDS